MSPINIKRMVDIEYISELFIAMIHGIQAKDQDSIDGFYRQYEESFATQKEYEDRYRKTINLIKDILTDVKSTRWKYDADFYSLFVVIEELSRDYHFPTEKLGKILEVLTEFDNEVTTSQEKSKKAIIRDYYIATSKQTTNLNHRKRRQEILRELLIPYLIARDSRRGFTEEERRIAWALSKNKLCAICNTVVKWEDYELDHVSSHTKGGKTLLENSQITHASCNASKGAKQ